MTEGSQPPTEMKACPYCGRMTSAKANFCWWCARELGARPERPESMPSSRPRRVPWGWIAIGLAVLTVAIVAVSVIR